MPLLSTQQLTYELDDGRTLFKNLTVNLTQRRTGIVGKNGAGKSVLSALFRGDISPTQGFVQRTSNIGYFSQISDRFLASQSETIAELLGVSEVLTALNRVALGHCEPTLFDVIGDNWNAHHDVVGKLRAINLPEDPTMPVSKLSGGEHNKLKLLTLFENRHALLILDEPSNHLDLQGKQWLADKINRYEGAVVLVSHDRMLLNDMEEIWEVADQTLHIFGGNYNAYITQKTAQHEALKRKLGVLVQQTKHLEKQAQHNYEKAQQRASAGNKQRKDGSQAKVLLDKKRDSATKAASARSKNERTRATLINKQTSQISKEYSSHSLTNKPLRFYLDAHGTDTTQITNKTAFSCDNVILKFGSQKPLSLNINANQKLHVTGANGSGKSTLLKTLCGSLPPQNGKLTLNSVTAYLDQHFCLLNTKKTVVDYLVEQCPILSLSNARTLLASAGLRNDMANQSVVTLSGGQKMVLAMLVVSNQRQRPFLLLDEPDNHLDIDAKTVLAHAIKEYKGGILLVSHDTVFIADCGITDTIHIKK